MSKTPPKPRRPAKKKAGGDCQQEPCSLPVVGMSVTPYGWGDPLLSGAFMACVNFATGNEEMRKAFEADAGCNLDRLVTGSPIEKMVDEATGFSRALVAAWFDWVALNVWGEEENIPAEPPPVGSGDGSDDNNKKP